MKNVPTAKLKQGNKIERRKEDVRSYKRKEKWMERCHL